MEATLGQFGDRRLEKGGRFFWRGWLRWVVAVFGFAVLAAAGLARSV
jgi:hypothetical protein